MSVDFERRYRHITGRPLLATVSFLIVGLVAPMFPLAILLLAPAAFIARRWLLLGAALFAIGFLRTAFTSDPQPPLPTVEQTVVGRIVSTPNLAQKYQRAILDIGDRNLLLYERPQRLLMAGDWVRVKGKIANIGERSAVYWARRGIHQRMSVIWDGGLEVLAPGAGPANWGSAWRTDMWSRLKRNLPERHAAMAMGIVAGQQDLVDREVAENMRRSGTLHLLATSGFNVLLLAGALMFLLSHLPISRGLQIGVALALLLAYADAVGGRPPVMRATVMAVIYLGAFLFHRSSDVLSTLGLAAIVYLLLEPGSLFDAGFQLSFVTVLGLALFVPPAFERTRKAIDKSVPSPGWRFVLQAVAAVFITSLVAQIVSAPLTAAHFGSFSLVAPVANVLTALAVPMIYLGTVLGQLADSISQELGRGFDLLITGPFAGWIDWVNGVLGGMPWAAVETQPISWVVSCVAYLALLALSRPHRRDVTALEDILVPA
ncbi:MAG: ComEC/Rec2 family competence protein [Fimbriimonadales bacterium]